MPICGGITSGATYDCANPPQPGVQPRIWLANKGDISTVTTGTNSSVITGITMLSGGAFYKFEGNRNSVVPQTAFVPQDVSSGYQHQVTFQVFDISSTQKVNLEILSLSKIVAIVENINWDGNIDSVFEVFGLGIGMEVQTLTRINNDAATAGSWSVDLITPETGGSEVKLPISFWDTDYATTLAKVVALETPAP